MHWILGDINLLLIVNVVNAHMHDALVDDLPVLIVQVNLLLDVVLVEPDVIDLPLSSYFISELFLF